MSESGNDLTSFGGLDWSVQTSLRSTPQVLHTLIELRGIDRMDFRDPSHVDESDEAILEQPYRPFYSLFGGKPILVKQ